MSDDLSKPRPRLSWFGRGFRERSPLVLLAAAAFVCLALLGFQRFWLDGGLTLVPESRLLRIDHDDYVHVVYKVNQLRKNPPAGPAIYLFGGSGTMECIVSEKSLSAAVSRDAGRPVQVISLAAHQQSLAMSLALIDNLPRRPAMIAVGLAPIRMTTAPAKDASLLTGRPVMVRSPRLASLAPRFYGRRPSPAGAIPGIFDYVGSYLRARDGRAGRPGIGDPVPYAEHYYPPGATGAQPLAKRLNVLTVLHEDVKLYARNSAYNLAMLEEILKLARDRGYSVALYDQPLNQSAADPRWAGVVPAYQASCSRLAREYGVPYLHIQPHVKLTDADFADLFHLLSPGRDKWQPVMARQLASAMSDAPVGPVAERHGRRLMRVVPPPAAVSAAGW